MSCNSWMKDLNLKRMNSSTTFKSYVDFDSSKGKDLESPNIPVVEESLGKSDYPELPAPCLTPSLLPGEVIIAEADNVLKFNFMSELSRGISGALVCTNFKISFVTTEKLPSSLHQRNLLLAENDVCLINVDEIYHINGGKRRKLLQSNLPSGIEIIEVHCKDFRIHTYSFKFSPANQKIIISAILHHAFVSRVQLLFAFDFLDPPCYTEEKLCNSLTFTKASDWDSELRRCNCPGWRVTQVNEKYLLCDSLPESFVVPSILLDMNLNRAAPHFVGHRVPTWSWGLPSGVSLVRMTATDSSISDNHQQDLMKDAISRASPRQQPVQIIDLDNLCPSVREIQSSFQKLKDLCMPTTPQEFWEKDNNYLQYLETTRWLHHVSTCLKISLQVAFIIQGKETVIVSEFEGRDVSCVICSLVQILLDPLYRSLVGFQILIQKEWVALGHPFTDRLRHLSGSEAEEAPVFLLFLDCVWQLMQQCPAVFEFSETFLTTLWDSCHISVFDTFLFNSPKCRSEALQCKNDTNSFHLRSVWNWSKQFSRNDIKLFHNPLYILNKYKDMSVSKLSPVNPRPRSFSSIKDTRRSQRRPLMVGGNDIKPVVWNEKDENLSMVDPSIKALSLWYQCYLRWNPLTHIVGGGNPVLYLCHSKLADEIYSLEKMINSLSTRTKHPRPPLRHRRVASDDYVISADSIECCQIQHGSHVVTSAFPFSPTAPWDWHSFQFIPSTSCLQISYTESDHIDDDDDD